MLLKSGHDDGFELVAPRYGPGHDPSIALLGIRNRVMLEEADRKRKEAGSKARRRLQAS